MPSSSLSKALCPNNASSAERSYGAMNYGNKRAASRTNQQKKYSQNLTDTAKKDQNTLSKNQVSTY